MTKASAQLFVLVMVTSAVTQSLASDCKCRLAEPAETTRWGGNMAVVQVHKGSFPKLEGIVQITDAMPLENALVEVFDHPEYWLESGDASAREPKQHRLSACVTPKDGRFCFPNLPDGKYELRSSLDTGMDVTHVIVVVKRKAGRTKTLEVEMHLGT